MPKAALVKAALVKAALVKAALVKAALVKAALAVSRPLRLSVVRGMCGTLSSMSVTARETALHLWALLEAERQRGGERARWLSSHMAQARDVLVDRHGARRVWLFGSLVAGHPTPDSDVDLATLGLAESAYFNALADLMAVFHGPVDLVRLEDAPESLRARVLSEGREL